MNKSGTQDSDDEGVPEKGVAGVVVYVDTNSNETLDSDERTVEIRAPLGETIFGCCLRDAADYLIGPR